MSIADELRGIVEGARDKLTPQDYELAVRVSMRYGELASARLLGEDVDEQLRIVQASANDIRIGITGSLGAAITQKLRDHLMGAVVALVGAL